MKIEFSKYQGNGNDFVVVDNRKENFKFSTKQISSLCDRHYGIGADGLMLVKETSDADFEMIYFNADGKLSSMCGNGGRCIAAFAYLNNIGGKNMVFKAFDGNHEAVINKEIEKGNLFDVSLSMNDVPEIEKDENFYFLDTGSPHYVEFVNKVAEIDVFKEGRKTRYSERFSPEGTNVNFVEISEDRIFVRTYERGVEDETLSCGTGVTAAAIATYLETGKKALQVHTTGGDFQVGFAETDGIYRSVWLTGPAEMVYKGVIKI